MGVLFKGLEWFEIDHLHDAATLLKAYADVTICPASWCNDDVQLDFNPNTGNVYLTNSENQVLILTDAYGLCMQYEMPVSGKQGTLPQLCQSLIDDEDVWQDSADRFYLLDTIYTDEPAFEDNGFDLYDLFDSAKEIAITSLIGEQMDAIYDASKHIADLPQYLDDKMVFAERVYPAILPAIMQVFETHCSKPTGDKLAQSSILQAVVFERLSNYVQSVAK